MTCPCENWKERIADFTVDLLTAQEAIDLQHHINECPGCKEYLEQLNNDEALFNELVKSSDGTLSRIEENVAADIAAYVEQQKLTRKFEIRHKIRRWLPRIAAVAAVIVIVAFIGILAGRLAGTTEHIAEAEKSQRQTIAKDDTANAEQLRTELQQVFDYAIAGNVDGLLDILKNGSMPAKLLAAKVLADLGEIQAVEPLQLLSQQSGESDNPFEAAAETILKSQQAETITANADDKTTQEPNLPTILSGFITDSETGDPVAGASVQILGPEYMRAYTDANGFYKFVGLEQAGNYQITIYSLGYIGTFADEMKTAIYLTSNSRMQRDIALDPGCMIDLDVVDANNQPIAGAFTAIIPPDDNKALQLGGSNITDSNITDANGRIMLGAVYPSDEPYIITVWHPDYAHTTYSVDLTDPETIEYAKITLPKGVEIPGYAEYADGIVAVDAKILARPVEFPPDNTINTHPVDYQGYFTLTNILDGQYQIGVILPDSNDIIEIGQMQLPIDEELLNITIPRQSPGSELAISGYLTQPQRFVVDIDAISDNGKSYTAVIGPNQTKFAIKNIEPGEYTLIFQSSKIEPKTIENITAPAENIEVSLESAQLPAITGSVINEINGQPITKFKIRFVKPEAFETGFEPTMQNWFEFENEQGSFSVETTGTGIYVLQIVADGFAATWTDEIDTDSNQPITIAINTGGSIAGVIVDQTGDPVEGASAKIEFGIKTAATAENGGFTLPNIQQGLQTLIIEHPDYQKMTIENIEVIQGQITDLGQLSLIEQ